MRQGLFAFFLCFFAGSAIAKELTIERLESGPSLNGPSVQGLKISPDGKRITFLKGKEEDPSQLDLWQFDQNTGKASLLVNSDDLLVGGNEILSEVEKARRERNRTIAGKSGIVSYFWRNDSQALVFPIGGDVYVSFLGGGVKRLTDTEAYETDVKFSPKGTYISFVRERNVYAVHIETGKEVQLTTGATDTIANGMAEFVAQEELGRYTGYWWSPDETRVVFEQFDESGVVLKDRYEVKEDGSVVTIKQRYPYAGTNNVIWKLGIVSLDNPSKVEWALVPRDPENPDDPTYLARLDWAPDSSYFVYQQLYRDQQTLNYVMRTPDGKAIPLGKGASAGFQDTSDVWINLTDDFYFLADDTILLTRTGEGGFKHIYKMAKNGENLGQVTYGDWVVDSIKRVDEKAGLIYFAGFKDTPLELHLYSVPIAGGEIKRITNESGWHGVIAGDGFFVDKFSNPQTPPQVKVSSLADGQTIQTIVANTLNRTHPYHAYRNGEAKQEFGTIAAEDGTPLHYRLYLPPKMKKGRRYPAIMAPYGGPHGQRVRQEWKVDFNEILARNGFVVMVLDNRGMWNRGKAFEAHIKNAMGSVEIEDQVAGVNYLKGKKYVDPDNVGFWGWSYGGYMTLMALFQEPNVFKAGVSVAPVSDWRLYDTAYTERYLGMPDMPGNVYENSSVFKYLDGFKGDLLLIHGMADDNVFFDHSVKLMAALQKAGKPFELMTYPGKKHGIRGYEARTHLWHLSLDFFNRKLKARD